MRSLLGFVRLWCHFLRYLTLYPVVLGLYSRTAQTPAFTRASETLRQTQSVLNTTGTASKSTSHALGTSD